MTFNCNKYNVVRIIATAREGGRPDLVTVLGARECRKYRERMIMADVVDQM